MGAGRKQATKNLRTIVAIEAARLPARTDDPKQWLLTLMRDPEQDLRHRVEAARALPPYFYTKPCRLKRQPIDVKKPVDGNAWKNKRPTNQSLV